jgi:hypothetical protein
MPPPPTTRGPPNLPKEEPAIPLEPAVAKARSAYIKNMIDKIKQHKNQGKTVDEIKQVEGIQRFSEDYPQLFKLLTKAEDYNEGSLRTMIALLEKMGTGEIDQNQASVIVGQRLHDIYIKPKLSE